MNASFLLSVALIVALGTVAAHAAFPNGAIQFVTVPTAADGNRYYMAYNPISLQNIHTPVPVAVFFHQLGSSCLDIMTDKSFGLQSHAEEHQVVVIAPCGVKGSLGIGWNAGTCCGYNGTAGPNDIAFALEVLDSVKSNVLVNTSLVGAFGMGNGAFLAQDIVCTAPHAYPFAGTVSGLVTLSPGNLDGMTQCTTLLQPYNVRPRTVTIQGDQDGTVGWSGTPLIGLPTPVENFMQWGARNQCINLVENWNQGNFESRKYTQCLGGGDVELVRWWGGGHVWPTAANENFSATTYLLTQMLSL